MRTLVTFQSRAFNTSIEKDYFINPGCFGDDVCKWLIQRLRSNGVTTDDEPGAEDFGWYFNFTVPEGVHCCIIGYRPGDSDDDGDWIAWIEKNKGFLGSIFGGRNKGISPSALSAIHTVLGNAPEIINMRWHEKSDFDRGREDLGTPTPL